MYAVLFHITPELKKNKKKNKNIGEIQKIIRYKVLFNFLFCSEKIKC